MEAQVGRVIAELDRLGLRENTIIVAWGDHGWHLGDQGLWCKHTNFEVAARAALMISAPGMKTAGAKTEALTELVDVYPTLCELAGLPRPDGLEGASFAPLLADPQRPWKSAAFSQYPRQKEIMGYSMRTDRYRYTEWRMRDGSKVVARELYDHETDPHETVNLAGVPEHAARVKELSERLSAGWRVAAASP
jgi:arylsulfatase A-like enzyme